MCVVTGKELIPERTQYTKTVRPNIDMKVKLKLNIGYDSFMKNKKAFPCKFQYKKFEKDEAGTNNKLLMKNWYFKENPHLIEFAKKQNPEKMLEDNVAIAQETMLDINGNKKKKKEESLLVWGNPQFGIYDRYGTGQCWIYDGPGNDNTCPSIGHYF